MAESIISPPAPAVNCPSCHRPPPCGCMSGPPLPPTTYAPNLTTQRPYAVRYRGPLGEFLAEFVDGAERDIWLATVSPAVQVLAVLNRVDPHSIPLRWRRGRLGCDFRADVAVERETAGVFGSWRSMYLTRWRETGDLSYVADAAYCAAVVSAANRSEG